MQKLFLISCVTAASGAAIAAHPSAPMEGLQHPLKENPRRTRKPSPNRMDKDGEEHRPYQVHAVEGERMPSKARHAAVTERPSLQRTHGEMKGRTGSPKPTEPNSNAMNIIDPKWIFQLKEDIKQEVLEEFGEPMRQIMGWVKASIHNFQDQLQSSQGIVQVDPTVQKLLSAKYPEMDSQMMAAAQFIVNFLGKERKLNSEDGMRKQLRLAHPNHYERDALYNSLLTLRESAKDAKDLSETTLSFIVSIIPDIVKQVLESSDAEQMSAYVYMAEQINLLQREDEDMESADSLRS